jgi:hypothetical protein
MNPLEWTALGLDAGLMLDALGLDADPWQLSVLRSPAARMLLLACRQAGKSTATAALALHTALFQAGALVLLLSPSLRQSGELFRKVTWFYGQLGRPIAAEQETALTLTLANGSRVVSLPSSEATIRGYSGVGLLVVDEAARVPDDLYFAVRPMLAVSGGRMVCLSTPFGKRGFFYEAWITGGESWGRVKVTAGQCSRIPASFLAEERKALGQRWYAQEYECSFEDVAGAVFLSADVEAMFSSEVEPLQLW